MRLFIALRLSDRIRDVLVEAQEEMRWKGVQGNYTKEENLHLTLAFIGEYPEPDEVLEAIGEVGFVPFRIALGETGTFPDIWWAGIEPSDSLEALVKRLRRVLAEHGIPFDRKKFVPHITLIRKPSCRAEIPLDEVIQRLPAESMTVDRISLMRSDRGKDGMIYTEIE